MSFFGRALLLCVIVSSIGATAQTAPATTQALMTLGQADLLIQQHRFTEAVEAYRALLRQGKSTASLYIRLAAALHQQNLGEPAHWQDEQVEWEHALIVDPKNLEALRGLFALQKLKLQFFSDAKSIAALRDAAGELISADPSNDEAQGWIDASYLIDWLEQTDAPDHDMNVHRQALAAQLQKNPRNPLFAYYIARTFVRQADSLRKHSAPADEKQHLADAIAVMQKTVDTDPRNSASWLLYYRVLLVADQVVKSDDKNDSTYSDRIPQVLSKAQEVAKSDDPAASEVATSAAAYLADHHHQSAQAEQVLRQRLAVAFDDQSARLMLTKVVDQDASKWPEMIDLLRRPVTDSGGPLVLSCKIHSALERETQTALLQLLISQWAATPPGPQRTPISDEIDRRMADLQRAAPQSISTLQLHAKLLMVRGSLEGAAEAVPELEKARRLFQQRSGELNAHDWDLDYLLATAYTLTNQTGLAKTLLWQIVDARPDAPQVHKSLLRLLIVDHEPDLASEQLQQLKRLTPTDSDLPQFAAAIALLRPGAGQTPDVQAVLKALPESTPQQIHAKITDERAAGRNDEVIRLYELLRKQNSADVAVVNALLSLYVAAGQNDQAQKVIQEALAAEPKNLALQLADAQLRQDAAKIDELTRQQMDAIADPFDRDMAWYAFHLRRHETKEALQHLDDAEKLRPQDPKLLNERFRIAMEQKQWDVAEKYVKLLGKIDADETGGWFDRCRLDVARGDLDTALKDAQELVQRYPDFAGCWIRLASVYQMRRQYQKAIDNFNEGLRRQNESLECLKGLVACSVALHKQEDARRYIDQALQIDPNNTYFREQSASWEKANCTPQEIIVRRKSARDANPQSFDAWQDLFFAYYRVAADSRAASDVDQSAAVAEQIKQQWPDDKFGYFALADVAKLRNDLVAGEKAISDLADRPAWSKSPSPWLALAHYYAAFRRADLQEIAYRQALDRDSQSIEAQNAAANFLIGQRRFNEALNLLSPDSPNAQIRRTLISCLISLNRNADAIKACEDWLAIHPEDDHVWTSESVAEHFLHRYKQAIAAASRALQLDPNSRDAAFARGSAYVELGPATADLALADLRSNGFSPTATPQSNSVHLLMLARAYLAAGKTKEALSALQLGLSIDPSNVNLRADMVNLYRHSDQKDLLTAAVLVKEAPQLSPADRNYVRWTVYAVNYDLSEENTDAAKSAARAALSNVKSEHDRQSIRCELYKAMVHDHEDQQVLDEADPEQIKSYDAPDAALMFAERAIAEIRLNKVDAAARDFRQMIESTDDDKIFGPKFSILMLLTRELPPDQVSQLISQNTGDHTSWLGELMLLCRKQGDLSHAAEIADKIEALTSDHPEQQSVEMSIECAQTYAIAGQSEKARATAAGSITAELTDADALVGLALLWGDAIDAPDLPRSQVLAEQAISVARPFGVELADAWDIKGWLLVQSGQVTEGMQYLKAAAAMCADSVTVHYHLGCTFQIQGHHDQAIKEWNLAKKFLDDHKPFSLSTSITDNGQLVAGALEHAIQTSK